jgi:hypothetical protein
MQQKQVQSKQFYLKTKGRDYQKVEKLQYLVDGWK